MQLPSKKVVQANVVHAHFHKAKIYENLNQVFNLKRVKNDLILVLTEFGNVQKKEQPPGGSRPIILFVQIKIVSWFSQDLVSLSDLDWISSVWILWFLRFGFCFSKDQDLEVQFFQFSSVWILSVFSDLNSLVFGVALLAFIVMLCAFQQYKDATQFSLPITYSAEAQKPSIFGRFQGMERCVCRRLWL